MTIASNIYCDIDNIRDILSEAGVNLATDDVPPTEYGDAMAKAGNKIDLYLARRYNTAQLMESPQVTEWAAAVAARYVRSRRGNPVPPGVAALYADAIAEMTEIKKGLNDIPGIGVRKAYAPGMSKMRATLRPYPRAVVEASQSTKSGGVASGYRQNVDPWDRFGFNADAFLNWSF